MNVVAYRVASRRLATTPSLALRANNSNPVSPKL